MTPAYPLSTALDQAEPKPNPTAERDEKKNYAERFSNQLAQVVADALRGTFPAVTPTAAGKGRESVVDVDQGQKRLDVKVTDPALGLMLSVSIKTYSFQDYDRKKDRLGRWTKNIVRNDHELRGEAMVLHQRQPYAVLIAVLFEPWGTCDDGNPKSKSDRAKSSFAHHVVTLAKRAGRGKRAVYGAGEGAWVDLGADDPRYELFEKVYIGLYETDVESRGSVRFFDVEDDPPRNGRPDRATTFPFEELIAEIIGQVERRNRLAPTWADIPSDDSEAG